MSYLLQVPTSSQEKNVNSESGKGKGKNVKFQTAKLNVCGMRYEIRWETLVKYPETRLGGLAKTYQENATYGKVCRM